MAIMKTTAIPHLSGILITNFLYAANVVNALLVVVGVLLQLCVLKFNVLLVIPLPGMALKSVASIVSRPLSLCL